MLLFVVVEEARLLSCEFGTYCGTGFSNKATNNQYPLKQEFIELQRPSTLKYVV